MNENNREGNTEIPEVEELVIEDGLSVEEIQERVLEHNTKVKEYKTKKDEANAQLFARTKKAEGFELIGDKWVKPNSDTKKKDDDASKNSKGGLTSEDVLVIVENKIPKEDIADVAEYAKFKGITIEEAVASPILQTILKDKAEKRTVANGTNTDPARRGSARLSDEALIANANAGKMPESAEDMSRLTILKRARK